MADVWVILKVQNVGESKANCRHFHATSQTSVVCCTGQNNKYQLKHVHRTILHTRQWVWKVWDCVAVKDALWRPAGEGATC